MKNLYDHFELIRKRPALFGICTVRDLFFFIQGYEVGNINSDKACEHFRNNFSNWLCEKEPNFENFGWLAIIEIYSTPISSLNNFFNRFDEFLKEVPFAE